MYRHNFQRSRRRIRKSPQKVSNELIITTVDNARNDDLPHYLNVGAGTKSMVSAYGDSSIDGIIKSLNLSTQSVSRVFIPQSDIQGMAGVRGFSQIAQHQISANYGESEHLNKLSRTYRIRTEHSIGDLGYVCDSLMKSHAIEDAQPNFIQETCQVPNDEFYPNQWALQALNCEEAWKIETGLDSVSIAVVDTGVELQHPDLINKLIQGADFVDFRGDPGTQYELLGDFMDRDQDPQDEDGHGTHVAGIAAASSDNGVGISGVCWGAKILPVRVLFRVFDRVAQGESSIGTTADIDAGIKFAVDANVEVINLSLGGIAPAHKNVLAYAKDRNVCVIAATGNENSHQASFPASNPHVLAVGAINEGLGRAPFSNYGKAYNDFVMAPGTSIASTFKDHGYMDMDGTSMATPCVSGVAALMISLARRNGQSLNVEDIYRILRETATPLGLGKGDVFHGQGLVNAHQALLATQKFLKL